MADIHKELASIDKELDALKAKAEALTKKKRGLEDKAASKIQSVSRGNAARKKPPGPPVVEDPFLAAERARKEEIEAQVAQVKENEHVKPASKGKGGAAAAKGKGAAAKGKGDKERGRSPAPAGAKGKGGSTPSKSPAGKGKGAKGAKAGAKEKGGKSPLRFKGAKGKKGAGKAFHHEALGCSEAALTKLQRCPGFDNGFFGLSDNCDECGQVERLHILYNRTKGDYE